MINNELEISSYECYVSLGCSTEEQSLLQPVLIDIVINFDMALRGSITDKIEDAVDYTALIGSIDAVAKNRSFHLIENLCFEVHQAVSALLIEKKIKSNLKTKATKVRVPVKNLRNGVSFTCQSHT